MNRMVVFEMVDEQGESATKAAKRAKFLVGLVE